MFKIKTKVFLRLTEFQCFACIYKPTVMYKLKINAKDNKIFHYNFFQTAYMVDSCSVNDSSFLNERCSKHVPQNEYSYLMDVPVISPQSGIIYANIFCAKCHNDVAFEVPTASLGCNVSKKNLDNFPNFLKEFEYQAGTLTWRKGKEKECVLYFDFNHTEVRWCSNEIINKCSPEWNRQIGNYFRIIEKYCLSKTFFVKSNNKYFKNPFCAICNEVSINEIKCLEPDINASIIASLSQFPIKNLLRYVLHCQSNQLWDPLNEKCTNVFCRNERQSLNMLNITDHLNFMLDSPSYIAKSCNTIVRNSEAHILYPNGTIYLRKPKLYFKYGEYELIQTDWIKICVPDGRWTKPMKFLSTLLISISLICLLLHMAIFIALPQKRNIPSMNLFSLTLALFASDLIFQCFFHYNNLTIFCQIFSALLYYFLCAAFIWMNVMSIDIFRTFRSSTYKIKSKRVFIHYSFYAWVCPVFSTSLVVLVDHFASEDFFFIPDLGSERCWFNNKWGHAVFFTIPAGLIVIVNMFLYGFSVWCIYKQRKLGKLAAASVQPGDKKLDKISVIKVKEPSYCDSNFSLDSKIISALASRSSSTTTTTITTTTSDRSNNNSFKRDKILLETEMFFQQKIKDRIQRRVRISKKHRLRLALYSKLALIMGMTWIFAFLSLHTKNVVLDYLFVIFNGLQGALIFLAFDCKKSVWNELQVRFGLKKLKTLELSQNDSKSSNGVGLCAHSEKISLHYHNANGIKCESKEIVKSSDQACV